MRRCGDCTLCCKLLPMQQVKVQKDTVEAAVRLGLLTLSEATNTIRDFDKPAGERCPHQRHHKGCAVYARRPFGCRFWNCRWLAGDDTADLSRPDRAHYVIDVSPDFVTAEGQTVPVIQVWLDPDYPDAHKDPALRAFLMRRAEEGYAALIRLNNKDAFALFAPPFDKDDQWREVHSNVREAEHTVEEKIQALGEFKVTVA